jgi:hypothetical protein
VVRTEQPREETLADAVAKISKKAGTDMLTDEEILVFACAEIARTYTYEEKGYLRR